MPRLSVPFHDVPNYRTLKECGECFTLVPGHTTRQHAEWHDRLTNAVAGLQEKVEPTFPEFADNTLWRDGTGHLWLAQLEEGDDALDVTKDVLLRSSIGVCTREQAVKFYGPWTKVEVLDHG